MIDNCCFLLAIRQRTCQNGVARVIDNIYINISAQSTYSLSFGYTLKVSSINQNSISINISNDDFIPSLIFNIPVNSYKVFDLPKESGTFKVYVWLKFSSCDKTSVSCNN